MNDFDKVLMLAVREASLLIGGIGFGIFATVMDGKASGKLAGMCIALGAFGFISSAWLTFREQK